MLYDSIYVYTNEDEVKDMFDIRKMQENALYAAVQKESDAQIADEVVYGQKQGAEKEDSAWVNAAMLRLEERFRFPARVRIRRRCQCGFGMEEKLALLNRLKDSVSSIEDLTASQEAKAAGLFSQNGNLYLQFQFCPCPMLKNVKSLRSDTWCLCTTGYSKELFEKAFSCEADVDLLQSIKKGDPVCLMKITLHNPLWR